MQMLSVLLVFSLICSLNCEPEFHCEMYAIANGSDQTSKVSVENIRIDAFTKKFDSFEDLCRVVLSCSDTLTNDGTIGHYVDINNKNDVQIKTAELIETFSLRFNDTYTGIITQKIDPNNNSMSYGKYVCQMFGNGFVGEVKWMYHFVWKNGLTQKEVRNKIIPTGEHKQLIWYFKLNDQDCLAVDNCKVCKDLLSS